MGVTALLRVRGLNLEGRARWSLRGLFPARGHILFKSARGEDIGFCFRCRHACTSARGGRPAHGERVRGAVCAARLGIE